MRIGIDARELCGRATGVGRYLGGLLHEWAADAGTRVHEFVLYAPEPISLPSDERRFRARLVPGSAGTWWEQMHAPRAAAADHLDVWFAPAYTAPLRLAVPIVVSIHDLSFVAHPEWFRAREGARRRWLTRRVAHKARAVITISEFSRRELVDRLEVPDARIHVIPPGIVPVAPSTLAPSTIGTSTLAPSTIGTSSTSHQQPPLRSSDQVSSSDGVHRSASGAAAATSPVRVLFVGSIFNRRHVADMIRAFAPIARAYEGASMDIVGDNRTYPHEDPRRTIASEGLEAEVRWHSYVTNDRLRDLYAQARAFVFLSEYEGLGLTPLEALAAGAPPVLVDTPVARESCGDAAVYVPVGNLPATTRALESVLFDGTVRARLLAAAPAELARYSWPRAARETLTVIERCA